MPVSATIREVRKVSERERFFRVSPSDSSMLEYHPGQFFMVGLPGYGEAPISVASRPRKGTKSLEFCIRAAGNLTNALHRLKKGAFITMRGPFGTGYPLSGLKGRDVLLIAGGIGIVPLRSLIKSIVGRQGFGRLTLLYGVNTPPEILFTDELESWRSRGVDVRLTVDAAHAGWKGNVGVVTDLISRVPVDPARTVAIVTGPPVMYRFVILALRKRNIKDESIYLSLERRMKCGVGKCGHCQINSVYTCQEGPVFRLSGLKGLPEALL